MRWNKKRRRIAKKFPFKKIIFPVLILVFLTAIYFIYSAQLFSIKSIEIKLNKIDCTDEEKIRKSINLLGMNFFIIDHLKIENSLKLSFYCIKSVGISKKFPSLVKLDIFGREGAAILVLLDEEATMSGVLESFTGSQATSSAEASSSSQLAFSSNQPGEKYVVDSQGVIFSKNAEQFNIQQIYISGFNLTLGKAIDNKLIINSLNILEKIKTFGIEVKEAKLTNEKLLLVNALPRIIFKTDADVDKQTASLQLILKTAKIDSNTLEFIDLRFDKPIVKFVPKKK